MLKKKSPAKTKTKNNFVAKKKKKGQLKISHLVVLEEMLLVLQFSMACSWTIGKHPLAFVKNADPRLH